MAAYYFLTNWIFGNVCPLKIIIGFPCPGCGLTRAALLLLQGNIEGSLRMNPTLLFVLVYFILVLFKIDKVASYYSIFIIILCLAVYGYRFIFTFGTEPIVYNPNNIARNLLRFL
jgi:hypothetical protein